MRVYSRYKVIKWCSNATINNHIWNEKKPVNCSLPLVMSNLTKPSQRPKLWYLTRNCAIKVDVIAFYIKIEYQVLYWDNTKPHTKLNTME